MGNGLDKKRGIGPSQRESVEPAADSEYTTRQKRAFFVKVYVCTTHLRTFTFVT